MNLRQLLAAIAAGKQIDLEKLDYAAIGLDKAAVEKLVAEAKNGLLDDLEIPTEVLKKKAEKIISDEVNIAKTQLYGTIEELKKSQQTIAEKLAAEEKAKADAAKAEAEAKAKKEREALDARGAVQELETRFSSLLAEQQRQAEERIKSVETSARAEILRLHKEKIIAASNGEIIDDLLVGDTPEELNASAEIARQKYAAIKQKAIEDVSTKAKQEAAEREAAQKAEEERKKSLTFVSGGGDVDRNSRKVEVDAKALKTANLSELAAIKDDVLQKFGL